MVDTASGTSVQNSLVHLKLCLAVSPVVPRRGHAVVPEHQQQRVRRQPGRHLLHYRVHLPQLAAHLGVIRPELVAGVVHAQKMPYENVPVLRGGEMGVQLLPHRPVHTVKVPNLQ